MNWKGGKQERVCKICEQIFLVYPGNKTQKSCSNECKYKDKDRDKKTVATRRRNGSYNFSDETRKRMSISQTGKKLSTETIEKLKLARKENKENGGNVNQYGAYKGGYANKLRHNLRRIAIKKEAVGDHTLQEWIELKEKTGNKCVSCHKSENEVVLTEDHIVPLSKGGTDYIDNIQPLCLSCNCKKMTKSTNYLEQNII